MKTEKLIIGVLLVCLVGVSGCTSNSEPTNNTYMSAEDVKLNSNSIKGIDLQRNSMSMIGSPVEIKGTVFDIHTTNFLMYMDGTLNEVVYVKTNGVVPSNLIKNDIVTVYGICKGKTEYNTAGGGSNTVPYIEAWPENVIIN